MNPLDFGKSAVEAHDSEKLMSDGFTADLFKCPANREWLVRSA